MSKNTFSKEPPSKVLTQDKENFIKGAETNLIESLQPPTNLPGWKQILVRKRKIYKDFLLKLPEEYYLKLTYLAHTKDCSMQKICQKSIMDMIDKEI